MLDTRGRSLEDTPARHASTGTRRSASESTRSRTHPDNHEASLLPRCADMSAHRFFLLSPASCGGKRAELVFNPAASFPLAHALRSPDGAALGEVFSFLSGLYFRGKLTYARTFASAGMNQSVHVITTSRGLMSPDERVRLDDLHEF